MLSKAHWNFSFGDFVEVFIWKRLTVSQKWFELQVQQRHLCWIAYISKASKLTAKQRFVSELWWQLDQKKGNAAFLGCCYVLVYYSKLMKISALIQIGMRSFMDFINVLEIECPATSSFTAPPWPSGRARKIKRSRYNGIYFFTVTLNSTSFVAILLFFFWYL